MANKTGKTQKCKRFHLIMLIKVQKISPHKLSIKATKYEANIMGSSRPINIMKDVSFFQLFLKVFAKNK